MSNTGVGKGDGCLVVIIFMMCAFPLLAAFSGGFDIGKMLAFVGGLLIAYWFTILLEYLNHFVK